MILQRQPVSITQLNPYGVPIQVPFFDDWKSYFHALLGFGMAFDKSAPVVALVALGYIFYQFNEVEPLENKIGDLAEFAVGFLASMAFPDKRMFS